MLLNRKGRASHRKAGPLSKRLGLSKRGWASHIEAGALTERQASHKEAGLFKTDVRVIHRKGIASFTNKLGIFRVARWCFF